jgi:hypothetical protein
MWVGFFLICAGILILLSNMDIIRGDAWNYIWPLILVFLGVSMILKRRGHKVEIHVGRSNDQQAPPTK